jgi:SpoVK/Ycf46/Vps4 family AAA+-type ATPase
LLPILAFLFTIIEVFFTEVHTALVSWRAPMNHLPEVLKILEGALRSNADQAVNYARLLIEKLIQEGEHQQARLVQRKLDTLPSKLVPLASGQMGSIPVDQESRLDLAEEEVMPSDEPRVLLDEHIRADVDRFLADARHLDRLLAAGVNPNLRMLIYGAPGVGKTHLARFIASELKLPLLTARCDTLISSFLGSTAKNIRHLFDHGAQRPCVLFLDEFDALAKARDDAQELGELKRVVVGLLQNIDALPAQTVLLAATNHEQLLDPAVWRRFDYRLQIHLPSPVLREALLNSYLGAFGSQIALNRAVQLSEGLSGGVIRQAVEGCVRDAILKDEQQVTEGRLLARIGQIILTTQNVAPTTEAVAELLLKAHVPLRTVAEGTGLSMRQILKRRTGRAVDKDKEQNQGEIGGHQGKPRTRR